MPLDLPQRLQGLPQKKLSLSTDNIDGSFTINSIEKSRISREIGNPAVTKNCAKGLLLRWKRNLHLDFSCRSQFPVDSCGSAMEPTGNCTLTIWELEKLFRLRFF